ncbi:hypothetical protein NEMIN01_1840 [Nematocida minor]|uniref:uncharacterized protein n=1 Tax=Nematocida minor TaxID=1912983 RepID=UPI00221E5213|nr:uncharacterized protein NEMIN01_1840 [Nematocida minor]KAI5192147.1 hypothetical protein NEMIN01_1840 [Nematocida minor]
MVIIELPRLPKLSVPRFREKKEAVRNKKLKMAKPSEITDENSLLKNMPFKPEKKHLCKYFVKNACIRGSNCTFSHDLSKFPCKLFHIKKNCRRKNCQFSHAPISEEEVKLLVSDGWELEKEEKEEVFISPFL